MQVLYNIGIWFYSFAVRLAALFNSKAKLRVSGYQKTFSYLASLEKSKKRIWFHCASLGEFEQCRPLLEKYQKQNENEGEEYEILVSFFSPSGYEVLKKKGLVDVQFYLPPDTIKNAQKLIQTIQPDVVVFVKYEFWANLIFELKRQNISLYCISALFREEQVYFKKNRAFFQNVLKAFDHIYVQNELSALLAKSIACENVTVTGDTRFDRVAKGAKEASSISLVSSFLKEEKALIVGSSWQDDEEVIFPLLNSADLKQKVIIAPHEIDPKHLQRIQKNLTKETVLFSALEEGKETSAEILIIDNIGMLSNLYQYGDVAYVGGAFHGSLHNILEPAAFGLPVIFGPSFKKFPEGSAFIENGIGFSISSDQELQKAYATINENKAQLSEKVKNFVLENVGSTDKIFEAMRESL